MKIPAHDPNLRLEKALLGVKGGKEKQEAGEPDVPNAATSADRVEISEKARTFQKLSALAAAAPKSRTERLDAIRRAVEGGRYHPEAEAVAEKLVRATLFDNIR